MKINKKNLILAIILLIATFLRFYNLMHDSPYFFNPDERNMGNAITQFRLPNNFIQIPSCIISQFTLSSELTINNQRSAGSDCNLNPRFFAYGQFPLYLAYASDQLTKPLVNLISPQPITNDSQLTTNFPSAIFWLRFWSALSSTLTVLLVYLITKQLFANQKVNFPMTNDQLTIIVALMAAFTPGLIQSAHFGTTESFLTFFFLASIYLSIKLLENPVILPFPKYLILNTKYFILLSFFIGLALGSKLTGAFFLIPPFISLIIQIIKLSIQRISRKKKIIGMSGYLTIGLLLVVGSILFTVISSPYNLVEIEDSKSAVFGYERDVALGKYEAFYTRQFVNTVPILFQMEKIFPYALGWPVFILGSLGFLSILFKLISQRVKFLLHRIMNYELRIKNKKNNIPNSYFLLLSSFLVFFSNSFLFAKWTRFMTPIFPIFAIFTGYSVFLIYQVINNLVLKAQSSKLKTQNQNLKLKAFNFKPWFYTLLFSLFALLILPGIAFMSIYTHKDVRVAASRWIYQNIPNRSYVLSETANVVDIPLGIPTHNSQLTTYNYTVISFDFYHMDENPLLFEDLLSHLEKADYIFMPSRRIFANYLRIPGKYPLVTKYYQLLFSGRLGFEKATEINSFPSIGSVNFPDENAEETFTVFDHPVVRIYKKIKSMRIQEYRFLFQN